MRIAVVSDEWETRWSAATRTLSALRAGLVDEGHAVELVGPERVREAGVPPAALLDSLAPEAVHLAAEGPLAAAAREACLRRRMPFTTEARGPGLRRFHEPAARVLVTHEDALRRLGAAGWARLAVWTPGVDLAAFSPGMPLAVDLPRPLTVWVGSLATAAEARRYLAAGIPGTRFVVGDGRARAELAREFPRARFTGELAPRSLRALYAACDALVHTGGDGSFPAPVWEALACGCPVAALPDPELAALAGRCPAVFFAADLREALERARATAREECRAAAMPWGSALAALRFAGLLVRGAWRQVPEPVAA